MQYSFDMGPVLAAWQLLLSGALHTLKISYI